jgi:hypothetical protein
LGTPRLEFEPVVSWKIDNCTGLTSANGVKAFYNKIKMFSSYCRRQLKQKTPYFVIYNAEQFYVTYKMAAENNLKTFEKNSCRIQESLSNDLDKTRWTFPLQGCEEHTRASSSHSDHSHATEEGKKLEECKQTAQGKTGFEKK